MSTHVATDENKRRRTQGLKAAKAGANAPDLFHKDDAPTAITDTLANLMHFAESLGIDFDNQLRIARSHFAIERTGIED